MFCSNGNTKFSAHYYTDKVNSFFPLSTYTLICHRRTEFHLLSITQSLKAFNHIFQISIKLNKPLLLHVSIHLVSLHRVGYIKQKTNLQNKEQILVSSSSVTIPPV